MKLVKIYAELSAQTWDEFALKLHKWKIIIDEGKDQNRRTLTITIEMQEFYLQHFPAKKQIIISLILESPHRHTIIKILRSQSF